MSILRLAAVLPLLLLTALPAEAQRFGRRAFYGSPYAGVAVSPYGVSVRTPYYSFRRSAGVYGVPPARYSARYGATYSWPGGSVTVGPRTTVTTEVSPEAAPADSLSEAPRFDSSSSYSPELASGASQAELLAAIDALHERLNSYAGGEGWQRYLTATSGDPSTAAYRETLLGRMDSVAEEPRYRAVSELDEFQQLHGVLQQMQSAAEPAAQQPSLPPAPGDERSAEVLPVPNTPPNRPSPPMSSSGERSVLSE